MSTRNEEFTTMLIWGALFFSWAFCVRCESTCSFSNVLSNLSNSKQICPFNAEENFPIVVVALLVRNKEHVFPHVLAYFEKQNYPKKRMILWIRSDHNRDKSGEILKLWLNHTSELYRNVDVLIDDRVKRYRGEYGPNDWTLEHRLYHMRLKENALNYARKIGADYVFFLDADVLLTHEETIAHLVNLRLPIVAPKLKSTREIVHYTTCRPTVPEISDTLLEVAAVAQAVLIKLDYPGAENLTFDMKGLFKLGRECFELQTQNLDPLILAASAKCSHIPTFLCHQHSFGYMMDPQQTVLWAVELLEVIDVRLQIIFDLGVLVPVQEYLQDYFYTSKRIFEIVFQSLNPAQYGYYVNMTGPKMLFDEIYMVNLDRRSDRRIIMEKMFEVQDLEVTRFPAVDAQNRNILSKYNITLMPEFKSPFRKKSIKLGEIGCFLSHYEIWKKMVAQEQQLVLIFEDDIFFGPCFKTRLLKLIESAKAIANYDLLYLGRIDKFAELEPWFQPKYGVQYVDYSYLTIGYILTLQGAKKLLAAKPLEKLLPVDEFLPIMYGAGRNKTRISHFPVRNLIALAPEIDLIRTLSPDDKRARGYVSDTKISPAVTEQNKMIQLFFMGEEKQIFNQPSD